MFLLILQYTSRLPTMAPVTLQPSCPNETMQSVMQKDMVIKPWGGKKVDGPGATAAGQWHRQASLQSPYVFVSRKSSGRTDKLVSSISSTIEKNVFLVKPCSLILSLAKSNSAMLN